MKGQAIQNTNIDKAQERQKKSYDAKHRPLKGGRHHVTEKLTEQGKTRRQTGVGMVRPLYHQQGVTKESL